jgi:hypothetical protein
LTDSAAPAGAGELPVLGFRRGVLPPQRRPGAGMVPRVLGRGRGAKHLPGALERRRIVEEYQADNRCVCVVTGFGQIGEIAPCRRRQLAPGAIAG